MEKPAVIKREHAHATSVPTSGYWEGPRAKPYGNMGMGICEGKENCDYWDHYYQQHNSHILGMFITWGFIASIVIVAGVINISGRHRKKLSQKDEEGKETAPGGRSIHGVLSAFFRKYFLPQSLWGFFPHVTRFQAMMVVLLTLYCTLFTFIGISYGVWVNPTKPPGRRIGFLEFSGDRTGCLAFAFVPLVFILSSRDNIFSLITGVSYQHFNFLHRWIGRFIFIMTWVHTVLWSIELGIMYQPQPTKYKTTWAKRYWKYGVGATALLTFLFLHSFRTVQKWTGYEFFRKSHEVVAVLFLGACWGHWPDMKEWIIAGIAIVFFDRGVRYVRMILIHMNWASGTSGAFGLHAFDGTISRHHDTDGIDVLVLRVKSNITWKAGQHFFLTFPTLSFLESHPFTASNIPTPGARTQDQLYIIRVLKGQTKRLADLCIEPDTEYPLPTIVCGPYGTSVIDQSASNYQLVAGGTGVSFTLPLAQNIIASTSSDEKRIIDFVWILRRAENLRWLQNELLEIRRQAAETSGVDLHIRVFVTREGEAPSTSSTSPAHSIPSEEVCDPQVKETLGVNVSTEAKTPEHDVTNWLQNRHPSCKDIVMAFRDECVGKIQVLASGPAGLGRDLREAVAECNDSCKVWRGDEGGEVGLYWDSR